MITILIGIAGYLTPGDEYQLILPEVASWTIDKRNKAQRKQNYQGGFSTSTTKYDESKFMSVSWDTLSEEDINQANGYDNYTEPVAVVKTAITVSTTPTVVSISNYELVPNNTKVYVRRGASYIALTATDHTATTIKLQATTAIALTKGESIYMYNVAVSGLLSLASISATGQTHLLRDFSGKLVKVLLNSPKYEAIGGSDIQGQLYFNARMDIDIVADTSTYQYRAVKAIDGSTYNEQLPVNNSIVGTPISASVTNLFVKTPSALGFISATTGTTFSLEALLPYKLLPNIVGSMYVNLAKQMAIFADYLSGETQVAKTIKSGTTTVFADPDPKITINLPVIPDYIVLGTWSPLIKYNTWDEVENTGIKAPLGVIVKVKGSGLVYLSLKAANTEPFTNTEAWLPLAGKTLAVLHKEKLYKMLGTSTGAATAPDITPASWELITIPVTPITVTLTSAYLTEMINRSLFLVLAPYTLGTDTTPIMPFDNSTILKIPVLKEQFTHNVEFSTSIDVIKTSSTEFNKTTIFSSAIDNTVESTLPANLVYNEYEPFKISGLIVTPSTTSSLSLTTESISLNINQVRFTDNFRLCTYTVVNNDPGFANVALGTLTSSLNNGSVALHFRDIVSKRRVFTGFTLVTQSADEVLQLSSAVDFTKSLYEQVYDHSTNKMTVTIYSYALAGTYKIVPIVNTAIDYPNVGFKITKTKKVYTSTTFTDTSTDIQTLALTFKSSASRVGYGTSTTYISRVMKDSYILKLFSLEGESWL